MGNNNDEINITFKAINRVEGIFLSKKTGNYFTEIKNR